MMNRTAIATGISLGLSALIAHADLSATSITSSQSTPQSQQEQLTLKRYIVLFNQQPQRADTTENLHTRTEQTEAVFSQQYATNVIEQVGGRTVTPLGSIAGVAAELNDQQLQSLQQHPDIRLIEEDPVRELQADYSGAMEEIPWGLSHVQADLLSDAATGNMKVCIVDTGYELSHEDLPSGANITGEVSNTLLTTYGERDLGNWSVDTWGHGTHMAGTIAALGNNTIGSWGLNPNGLVNLHIVKVIDSANWWPLIGSDLIAGVEACQAAGANIVNLSLAGTTSSESERLAMEAAYNAGMLVFGAAGHSGNSAEFFPASYDSVVSVTAIDQDNARWHGAPFNDAIEFSAPGVQLRSTKINSTYGDQDGTSVATAYMSGVAALVWSHHPECTNTEIRHILQATAKDLGDAGRDTTFGYGLVQAKDALDLIDQNGCDGLENAPPVIAGEPALSVSENRDYQFIPTASDPENDTLRFSISGKPAWATFNPLTGELSGNPGGIGDATHLNIEISVSDGTNTTALAPFSIYVVSSIYTDWESDGEPPVHTGWQPEATTQTGKFFQTSTSFYSQIRWETQRELSATGNIIDVGNPVEHRRLYEESSTRIVFTSWSDWADAGDLHSCTEWTPATDTVNYGQTFTQTRDCQQREERNRIYTANNQTIAAYVEMNQRAVNQTQDATGSLRDWQPATPIYTIWIDDGNPFNYGNWTPVANVQTADFMQTRSYQQNQLRFRQDREQDSITGDYRDVGEPVQESRVEDRTETRTVTVSTTTPVNSGNPHTCSAWTPDPSSVDSGTSFTQTRSCQQDRSFNWEYKVGATVIHTRGDGDAITITQSQQAVGTLCTWNAISPEYSAWANTGAGYNYSAWSPVPSNQTATYTQHRSFSQDQTRSRQNREQCVQTNAIRPVGNAITETQTVTLSDSRPVNITVSGWSAQGAEQCGAWSPATSTVDYGQTFTQTQQCSQDYQRTWNYNIEGSIVHSRIESKTETSSNSRSATGSHCNWINEPDEYSSWFNTGSPYSYSGWSPAAGSQSSNFSQSRTYRQDQFRTRYQYQYCQQSPSNRRLLDSDNEHRTITPSEYRTVSVNYSNWVNSGSPTNCSAWSPHPSSVNYGQVFTQTRRCDQNQTRTVTYTAGGTTLNTRGESQTVDDNQSQPATGTKDFITDTSITYTPWINDGGPEDFGAWSDQCENHDEGTTFTRSRSYIQVQERDANYWDHWASGKKTLNKTLAETRNVPGTQTQNNVPGCRSVSGNWSSFSYVGTTGCNHDLGVLFSRAAANGYPAGSAKSGSCSPKGIVHKFSTVVQSGGYCGGSGGGFDVGYAEQTCQ